MKFPNHIILDCNINSNKISSSQYWLFQYLSSKNFKISHNLFFNFFIQKKFLKIQYPVSNFFKKNQHKFTFRYDKLNFLKLIKNSKLEYYEKLTKFNLKIKNKSDKCTMEQKINHYLFENKKIYDEIFLKYFYKTLLSGSAKTFSKYSFVSFLFDINFLKKEKMYTKLKYSRVPQYDIVSGGSAALFAGFLGFLICEKFGFELLDSGDFYIFFMYMVFFFFSCKLFLKLHSQNQQLWSILNLKWFFFFYKTLFILFLNFLKNLKIK